MKTFRPVILLFISLAFLSCENRTDTAQKLWSEGKQQEAISALLNELEKNPDDIHARDTLSKFRSELDDTRDWIKTDKAQTLGGYQKYLDTFPHGLHVKECKARYNNLLSSFFQKKPRVDVEEIKARHGGDFWNWFYPEISNLFDGKNIREVLSLPNETLPYLEELYGTKFDCDNRVKIEEFIYNRTKKVDTISAYRFYLREYPAGRYNSIAIDRISFLANDDALYSSIRKSELNLIYFLSNYPAHRRYSDAQEALSLKLGDWQKGKSIARVLEFAGWQPRTDKEKILFWVAKKERMNLFHNWDATKNVLTQCIASPLDNAEMLNAVYALIFLGNNEVLQLLENLLNDHGNKELAEAYLNSGNKVLYKCADEWVRKNNKWVISGPEGNSPVRWNNKE